MIDLVPVGKFDKRFKRKEEGYESFKEGLRRLDALMCMYSPKHIPFKKRNSVGRFIKMKSLMINEEIDYYKLLTISTSCIERLKQKNPSQFIVTNEERKVADIIKTVSPHKFKSAYTVGGSTFDLFCNVFQYNPIRSKDFLKRIQELDFNFSSNFEELNRTSQGLIVEVDGSVHFSENKMRMDNRKFELAANLGIMVVRVDNSNVGSHSFKLFLKKLRYLQEGCSKSRKALNTKIMLSHVAFLANEYEIKTLTGLSVEELLAIRSWIRSEIVPFTKAGKSIWDN